MRIQLRGVSKTFRVASAAFNALSDIDLDLGPSFGGQFIYEDTLVDPATGSASGSVTVETCQTLTQTPPWN